MGACTKIQGDDICQSLSVHCSQLITLDLWRCPTLTARGIVMLSTLEWLADLDIGWCVNVLASTGCLQTLVGGCQRLQRLLLTAHRQTSDADIRYIGEGLANTLRQFSCMGSRSITTASMLTLANRCQFLELLDISYCENLESTEFQRELFALLPDCHIVTSLNSS